MPQVQLNTSNITDWGFDVEVDVYTRTIKFSIASLTNFLLSGGDNVLGVAFFVEDSSGLELMTVDWDSPHINPQDGEDEYILDLSSSPLNFFFQNYRIIGYIKDEDGTVYQTVEILKNICQPKDITEMGYVPGNFEIIPDCINNVLLVKEFTPLVYNNISPESVTKSGVLSYPSGTISSISFASTPFSNNVIYTGEYRVNCTTEARYDMGDNVYVIVSYVTNRTFPVTCSNFIGDITCCLTDVYNTYQKNCENATGQAALQKYNSVLPSILNGLVKQINGQDASKEVADIKKILNCDCGKTSLHHNEATPTNPAIYSIVLNGSGGTTIGSPTITGNTKTYTIASKTYVIAKGDTGDLAYTIRQKIVGNVVTYEITFNYDVMADSILDAIAASPTLLNYLNSLVTAAGSILGLDGKCVIDLEQSNYSLSQSVTGSTLITNVVINGTIYAAPSSTFANNATTVAAWLNSLTKGTFTAVVASNVLTIQSVNNTNTLSTVTFTTPDIVKMFSSTNATLVQVLQALVDYLCELTAFQMELGYNLTLCSFDYNGSVVNTSYGITHKQSDFNSGVASSICMIAARINTLSGVTCDKLKEIFIDRATVSFGANDRIFGTLGGDCAGLTDQQIAKLVIAAVGKYDDVKTEWCAIDCTVPGVCPDVSEINASIISGNIAIYGVTFGSTTSASQNLTVKYRTSGTLAWYVSTQNLTVFANGSLSGSSPYQITGLSAGTTYDLWIANNCGGSGSVIQITVPTSSVYEDEYYLDNIIYDICGATPVTLYSSSPFAAGVTMYSDIGLTTVVTGYTYITKPGSNIHQLNTSTGVVGTDTGSQCDNGVAGTYILGSDTGFICGSGSVTLYTDGDFAVGKILYTDSALTSPQTPFPYVVYNGVIYNKSTVTGAVTSSTGLTCLNYTLSGAYNFSINSVSGVGVPTLPATGPSGTQQGHHTAMSGNYNVVLSGSVVIATKVVAYVNGVVEDCLAVTASGTHVLAITAAETDTVVITLNSGTC